MAFLQALSRTILIQVRAEATKGGQVIKQARISEQCIGHMAHTTGSDQRFVASLISVLNTMMKYFINLTTVNIATR